MSTADPMPVDGIEAATMRTVIMRVMPFMMLCYFIAYPDRSNVGFAALQMNKALRPQPGAVRLRRRAVPF